MKHLNPVEIYWFDSQTNSGWQDAANKVEETTNSSLLCRSVGMFVKKTKDRIIIAQSVAFANTGKVYSITDTITIPLCAVKEIKKL